MIIALSGPAGCGKSTAAAHLAEKHGFTRIRFADPLKGMMRAFLAGTGMSPGDVERHIEGDLKEAASPILAGRSPRFAMQRLGTEFGREMLGPDLWVEAWRASVLAALDRGTSKIVAEDCRFPNESTALAALGGRVIQIERPLGATAIDAHVSEGQDIPTDVVIRNDGPAAVLYARLDEALLRFGPTASAGTMIAA